MDQDVEDTAARVPTAWPIAGAIVGGFVLFYRLSGTTAWIPGIATAIMELGTVGLVLIALDVPPLRRWLRSWLHNGIRPRRRWLGRKQIGYRKDEK